MTSTVFTDRVTPIMASWLNDVNTATYFKTLYIAQSTDTASTINAALLIYPGIVFKSGVTYNIAGDVSIPSNCKIVVEKGATVINTGGRFTADTVNNVEWLIDGVVKSVSMSLAAAKPLWTAETPAPRGFIEFGYNYSAGTAGSGFWVHGTGVVCGDWTGTPNYSDATNQTNRKGIATWNSKNVLVEGLEVYGFHGEAIYASVFDTASHNIVFRNNNVHDTRFSALNFNSGANGGKCAIINNRAYNAYQIETSIGECSNNYIENMVGFGIYTGSGAGYGPIYIKDNIIKNCGSAAAPHGIIAAFGSGTPVTDVCISGNTVINPYGYGIYTDYCRDLIIKNNTCVGTGQSMGSYDIGVFHALRCSVSDNTFLSPGTFAQAGRVGIDTVSYDVSINPDTNVYLATTGTATPKTGNGVQTVASATALPIPALGSIFSVTGTTTITSITSPISNTNNDGREITLIFTSALTFTDGNNLKLAGNLVTTADDTITLVCDGTNWYEKSRSVN